MKDINNYIIEKILINNNTKVDKEYNLDEFFKIIYDNTGIDLAKKQNNEKLFYLLYMHMPNFKENKNNIRFVDVTNNDLKYYNRNIRINTKYDVIYIDMKNADNNNHIFSYVNHNEKTYKLRIGYYINNSKEIKIYKPIYESHK